MEEIIFFSLLFFGVLLYFFSHKNEWKGLMKEILFFISAAAIGTLFLFGQALEKQFFLFFTQNTETVLSQIIDTEAPKIQITFPSDGQVFLHDTDCINVTAKAWDAIDPNPTIQGTEEFCLQDGFNSIIVTAQDQAGNTDSNYVVIERK